MIRSMNAQQRYQEYLKTDYWKEVQLQVKKRAGFRCQVCNSQMDLVAHHRCYDHRGSELEHLGDLTCLCARCHSLFHGKLTPEQKSREQNRCESKAVRVKTGKPKYEVPHSEEDVDKDMPPGEGPITLTEELVSRLRTNGAFCNGALRPLGLTKREMYSGWPARLVGRIVSRQTYRQCLRGRYQYGVQLPAE